MKKHSINQVIKALNNGGIAVIPTDTIYGIVAKANDKKAIDKVYKTKGRDDTKPLIVLINNLESLKIFGVKLTIDQNNFLNKNWPGKISIILPVNKNKFKYIHRGIGSIAFRMIGPVNRNLFSIIESVGPIIAPSANPQGLLPATCIHKSYRYFGNVVDAYLDGGTKKYSFHCCRLYKRQTQDYPPRNSKNKITLFRVIFVSF